MRRFRIEMEVRDAREPLAVTRENPALLVDELIDPAELGISESRLQIERHIFEGDLGIEIAARCAAVVSQKFASLEQRFIVEQEHAALAGGDRLGAMKAEGRTDTELARADAFI